jgi:hypothetical protein
MPPKQKQAGGESGSTDAKTPENDGNKIGDDEINTEVWEIHKDYYFYFTPLSGKVETKDLKNGGTMKLFTIDGISSDGSRVLVEVWGDSEATLYHQMFETAARKNQTLFRINPVTCVEENDAETLILVPCPPNSFQDRYRTVFKLQRRSKKGLSKRTKMANVSFPKPVKWRSGAFTFANGEPVPHGPLKPHLSMTQRSISTLFWMRKKFQSHQTRRRELNKDHPSSVD